MLPGKSISSPDRARGSRGGAEIKSGKGMAPRVPSRMDVAKRSGSHTPRVAPDWWEREVKGKSGLRLCSCCQAVYFDKHWHTAPKLAEVVSKEQGVPQEICPECQSEKEGRQGVTHYEGEVLLKNLASEEEKAAVLRLVRNVGKRAVERDPEDQILRIDDQGAEVRIRTSENQLAVSIGKQVAAAFKGGALDIKWSHEDAPVRVSWTRKVAGSA